MKSCGLSIMLSHPHVNILVEWLCAALTRISFWISNKGPIKVVRHLLNNPFCRAAKGDSEKHHARC